MLTAGTLLAQNDTIGAVIQVENDYAPVVVKATKMGFTPQIEIPSDYTPIDLIFSQKGEPFGRFVSERNIKDVLPTQESRLPGYARAGYGTGNNLDLKASYRLNIGRRDQVNIIGSMDGFDTSIESGEGEWDSRFFTTWINADYTHLFDNLSLGVEADFKNRVFNYLPTGYPLPDATDKQNSASYTLLAKAASRSIGALSYNAYAGITLSGRKYSASTAQRIAENRLRAGGSLRYELPYNILRSIEGKLDIDAFLYNSALKPDDGPGIHDRYSNYTLIRMNPAGNLRLGDWKARVGLHADIVTAGSAFLAVAPDLGIEGPLTDKITLYAAATGGRRAASFEALEALSPYWHYIPGFKQYTPSYNLCDISAGLRTKLGALSANLYVGYSYTIDDLMPTVGANGVIFTGFTQADSRDIYAGLKAGYDFGGWLDVEADVRYDHQGCNKDDAYLMYKPMLTAGLAARARIIEGLYANVGYTFTAYTEGREDERIDPKNSLEASISYRLHQQINIFVRGNNILSSEYEIYPGYTAQGANIMAGAAINF